jgi:carbohydrate-binding DOMON domain-containing protein
LEPQADNRARAVRVHAAILVSEVRDMEEEWTEGIKCFLQLKKDKTTLRRYAGAARGFVTGIWRIGDILSRVYV